MAHFKQSSDTVFDAKSVPEPEVGYEPAHRVTQQVAKGKKKMVLDTECNLPASWPTFANGRHATHLWRTLDVDWGVDFAKPENIDPAISQQEFPDFNDCQTRVAALVQNSTASSTDYTRRPSLSWTETMETCYAIKSKDFPATGVGYEPEPRRQDRKVEFCRLDLMALLIDEQITDGSMLDLGTIDAFNEAFDETSFGVKGLGRAVGTFVGY